MTNEHGEGELTFPTNPERQFSVLDGEPMDW